MANSVDPDQTASLFWVHAVSSILNSSVMLGNYLQQTTSADDIFRCIFFLGALRVNTHWLSTNLAISQLYFLEAWCKIFRIIPEFSILSFIRHMTLKLEVVKIFVFCKYTAMQVLR